MCGRRLPYCLADVKCEYERKSHLVNIRRWNERGPEPWCGYLMIKLTDNKVGCSRHLARDHTIADEQNLLRLSQEIIRNAGL